MKFPACPLLLVVLGLSTLRAAPPAPVTPEERAAIEKDAASAAPAARAAGAAARAGLQGDLAEAATASKAAATFLAQAGLPAVPADEIPAPAKPLDLQPGESDTVIHCEGGIYFDAEAGVLVYLKNVTVKDPRYDLSGANELKIFLEKKPAPEKKTDDPEKAKPGKDKSGFGGDFGGKFGDVERIVATGAIRIEQKAVGGKEPIQASGAIFTYNIKADQVIISGGFPWVLQGKQAFRATEPNLILRLSPKTGEMRTEGRWDTILNLEQKK